MVLAIKKATHLFLFFFTALLLSGYFILLRNHPLWVDEKGYYAYVVGILEHHFSLPYIISQFPKQAALPTYNIFLAFLAKCFNRSGIADVRLYTFLINYLSIPVFYWAAKKLDSESALIKTAQYCFLPILFPFFFLIYTDFMSLLLVLLLFLFVLRQDYTLAGICSIACIFVRQNNLMWVMFAFIYLYFRENQNRWRFPSFLRHLRKSWLFILGVVLFATFVLWNKGILCGHSKRNPLAFYTNNLYFVFFALFSVFLPVSVATLAKAKPILKMKWFWIALPALFILYMMTFWNNNTINRFNEVKELSFDNGMFFLRNRILTLVFFSTLNKALFFIPIVLAGIVIATTRFYEKGQYLLYPVSFIYLAILWAVEPRYYFISFVLFHLFRRPCSITTELLNLAYFIIVSNLFYYFMMKNIFFI